MALEKHDYVILVTDENLVEIGQPITNWTHIEAERKWNEPKFASVTVPAFPELLDMLFVPGRRAVLIRDGAYYVGGPIERPAEPLEWTADADGADGVGEVSFTFTDDSEKIASRLSLPDPTKLPEDPAQPEAWVPTPASGESVLRGLVNTNCIAATGVVAYRKIPKLALGAVAGVGSTIAFRSRFEPLGDAMRRAALAAGGLGYETVQTATAIEFRVFAPVDRTAECRYSRSVGNLRGIHYESEAPSVSDAIVGGGGEGVDRIITRVVNTDARSWGVREKFVDQRNTTDNAQLDQAGMEAVTQGAETAKLTVVVVAGEGQPIPNVGDLVTVELWPGHELAEVVRADHLEVDADGELLTLLVGSEDASPDPQWIQEVRRITRSLGRLEAT